MSGPLLRLEVVFVGAVLVLCVGLFGAVLLVRGLRRGGRRQRWIGLALTLPGAAVLACLLYAHFIEPDRLQVTHLELRTERLPAGTHLRIAQLSDTHLRGWTRAIARARDAVIAARPDLVIFTGDAADSPEGVEHFRELLASLPAPLGRYAVRGNHDFTLAPDALFRGVAEELVGSPVPLLGGRVVLCGAPWNAERALSRCVARAAGAFRIAVYHTPDLVEALAPLGPELYLAGHTHGGQVRLPFYGAVITFSRFDKRFDMGRYQLGRTTLYVNRGLGEESRVPRLRFLCPPEVTILDLVGTGPAPATSAPLRTGARSP